MDRVANEEVRRRAGIESQYASKVDQSHEIIGHVERMDEYCMPNHTVLTLIVISMKKVDEYCMPNHTVLTLKVISMKRVDEYSMPR